MSGYNATHGHRGGGGGVGQKEHVQGNGLWSIVQRALHPFARCLTAHRRPLLPHQVSYLLAGVFDQEQPWDGWYSCQRWCKPNHGDVQFVCQSYSVQIPDMWHHLWGLWTSDIRTCLVTVEYLTGMLHQSICLDGLCYLLKVLHWYCWQQLWCQTIA